MIERSGYAFARDIPRPVSSLMLAAVILLPRVATVMTVGPQNTAAISGQSTRLTCSLDHGTCDGVTWARTDHNGASVILHVAGRMVQTYNGRYSVSGSRDNRCSLDVTEVRQSDAGLFTCIEASEQSDRQTKYSAFLAVAATRPRLRVNKTHVMLNDLVSITCSMSYRSPLEVTLTLTEASRTLKVTSMSPVGRDTCSCTVSATVRARKPQFGPFRCLAVFTRQDNTSDELARNSVEISSQVIDAIRPAYDVTGIRLEPAETAVTVGQMVRCTSEGYPPPRYRWIRLRDNVEVSNNDTLIINNNSSGANVTYMCIASNIIDGKETTIYSQHVYFKPASWLRPMSRNYSSLMVVIATAASTVVCFVVVLATTVCVNCLRRKYCNANAPESDITLEGEATYEVLRRQRTTTSISPTTNSSSDVSSTPRMHASQRIRHLPSQANRPDVTLASWIEDDEYAEVAVTP